MNFLDALDPYRWLIAGGLVAAVVVGVPIAKHHYDAGQQEIGASKQREEDQQLADAQTARNRELQRAAEIRYTVTAEVRDRFITKTITEVRYATAALAACPVGADAVRLFNRAASCAREDSPAACGADQPMPGAH